MFNIPITSDYYCHDYYILLLIYYYYYHCDFSLFLRDSYYYIYYHLSLLDPF